MPHLKHCYENVLNAIGHTLPMFRYFLLNEPLVCTDATKDEMIQSAHFLRADPAVYFSPDLFISWQMQQTTYSMQKYLPSLALSTCKYDKSWLTVIYSFFPPLEYEQTTFVPMESLSLVSSIFIGCHQQFHSYKYPVT